MQHDVKWAVEGRWNAMHFDVFNNILDALLRGAARSLVGNIRKLGQTDYKISSLSYQLCLHNHRQRDSQNFSTRRDVTLPHNFSSTRLVHFKPPHCTPWLIPNIEPTDKTATVVFILRLIIEGRITSKAIKEMHRETALEVFFLLAFGVLCGTGNDKLWKENCRPKRVGINELHLLPLSSTHFSPTMFHSPHLLDMPCLSIFFLSHLFVWLYRLRALEPNWKMLFRNELSDCRACESL